MTANSFSTVFTEKYESAKSDWGGHSGGGSSAFHNLPYRNFLEQFLLLNKIATVTDIGCGDWQFSKFVDYDSVQYQGYDVVPSVIERNTSRYASGSKKFSLMPESYDEIAGGDLLIVKDVLQHLPDRTIFDFKEQVFPKFKYCLITNSYKKRGAAQNHDIEAGGFRCLDLNADPYRFDGTYVLEFHSALWELIRVLLIR